MRHHARHTQFLPCRFVLQSYAFHIQLYIAIMRCLKNAFNHQINQRTSSFHRGPSSFAHVYPACRLSLELVRAARTQSAVILQLCNEESQFI